MERVDLNQYVGSLIGLASEKPEDRSLLIEMAESAESLEDLLREWLWLHGKGTDSALKIKLWLGLNYVDLVDIFFLSFREVTQLLRSKRVELLGSYPGPEFAKIPVKPGEFSCFLAEQYLSPWIDGEWEELSVVTQLRGHLDTCKACRERLEAYRQLQSSLLLSRPDVEEVSEAEWVRVLTDVKKDLVQSRIKWLIGICIVLLVSGLTIYAIHRQPDKTPNVYEGTDE